MRNILGISFVLCCLLITHMIGDLSRFIPIQEKIYLHEGINYIPAGVWCIDSTDYIIYKARLNGVCYKEDK